MPIRPAHRDPIGLLAEDLQLPRGDVTMGEYMNSTGAQDEQTDLEESIRGRDRTRYRFAFHDPDNVGHLAIESPRVVHTAPWHPRRSDSSKRNFSQRRYL